MLLMTISAPNEFTKIFSESRILKMFGKYSFGMYILHPQIQGKFSAWSFKLRSEGETEYLILTTAVGLCAKMLFFHLIETPLMNLAEYLGDRVERLELFHQVQAILLSDQQQPTQQHISIQDYEETQILIEKNWTFKKGLFLNKFIKIWMKPWMNIFFQVKFISKRDASSN